MQITTVIMAGGLSRRMGRDKGLLPFGGESLLERMIQRWSGVFDAVAVSLDRPGRYGDLGVLELVDLRPGAGPMAGLEAALSGCGTKGVFLTAVDLPFGEPALARRLARESSGADVCLIRRASGRPEPLFALYTTACLPVIRQSLDRGERALFRGLYPFVHVREIPEQELTGFDLDHILFNMNRPQDWQAALAQEGHLPGK